MPPSLPTSPESVRLAKRLADLISCSRSEAEQYIQGGWVAVDGQIVEEPGVRVLPEQKVELNEGASLVPIEPVTILLHKPADALLPFNCADAGADISSVLKLIAPENLIKDDRSGIRFLKHHLHQLALMPPFETDASGLLVFTQDWRIKRKLNEDALKVEQEYIVEVSGEIIPDGLKLLSHGMSFNGKPLPPIKVSWQNEHRLRFPLKAPPRGLIAHMCEKVGLTVVSIKRIRVGRVPMASLPVGQWRYLLGDERF
ncbi:rRNA pseudouridine synthase [Glaciimonas soli]|uniref:Dual-specificity RNA pseudouridine synthase RluF n=1 Tax=Glaciimonas soli TaxID=2590999 RepID=A0A843YSQ6_9BURK|nr:rRNA pseudouridine synthase [Glaciimonas soli]MQQ99715.1 RNA-binding protein [Glaciimonas soli]